MFRTAKVLLLPVGFLASTGCVVYSHDTHHEEPEVVYVETAPAPEVNYVPIVDAAEVGVFFDPGYHDDIWYFEAIVDDGNGPYDVVEVWGDVYDEYTGQYIQSFELFPTSDPYVWYAEYLGSTTFLNPYYRGYTVDLVAYDSYGDFGWATVWAWTY